jgi:hypothetical protein
VPAPRTPADGTAAPSVRRMSVAVALGGLVVALLDALFAVALYRATPAAIFRSIASGVLGRAAYGGGLPVAALGAALHLFIATTWTALYAAASTVLPVLVRRRIPCGMAYGVLVYLAMNYVVLPLSAVPFARPFHLGLLTNVVWLTGLAGHVLLIGLPIALIVGRGTGRR